MRDDDHRAGAVFWLSEPLTQPWDVNLQDDATGRRVAQIVGFQGRPHLVVRLCDSASGYAAARRASLRAVQRVLDVLSVVSPSHLQLRALRGEQEHLVWWESKELGHVLRCTVHGYLDHEMVTAPLQRMAEQVRAAIPPELIAPAPKPPDWHPSFRYFRAAQCSDDLANAFRNMYLALESVLDAVVPKAGSGLDERHWLKAALEATVPSCQVAERFATRSASGSAVDFVISIYQDKRLPTFHSKAGAGSRLPFVEDDERHGELEQAFTDLSDLYLDLARIHLGADRRVGTILARGGWDLLTSNLFLGATDLYVTTDDAPIEDRVDDTELNPRNAAVHLMRTRNATRLEGPFDRVFIGKSRPGDAGHPTPVHGWTVSVRGEPFSGGTFEAPLHLDGVDQLQLVVGYSYQRPDLRATFKS
ncbi:MAG: hypothetical protein R8G01_08895 [Ilumatobacteraceae bacterium]|nr:hypothetical protein [Ilumatobacteraceae bacterium]